MARSLRIKFALMGGLFVALLVMSLVLSSIYKATARVKSRSIMASPQTTAKVSSKNPVCFWIFFRPPAAPSPSGTGRPSA